MSTSSWHEYILYIFTIYYYILYTIYYIPYITIYYIYYILYTIYYILYTIYTISCIYYILHNIYYILYAILYTICYLYYILYIYYMWLPWFVFVFVLWFFPPLNPSLAKMSSAGYFHARFLLSAFFSFLFFSDRVRPQFVLV